MNFFPTAMFGFLMLEDKPVIHQMWVNEQGLTEGRPVPMIELSEEKKQRPAAVAGFVSEDEDE